MGRKSIVGKKCIFVCVGGECIIFATELDLVDKTITPQDLYQGSRLSNALVDVQFEELAQASHSRWTVRS